MSRLFNPVVLPPVTALMPEEYILIANRSHDQKFGTPPYYRNRLAPEWVPVPPGYDPAYPDEDAILDWHAQLDAQKFNPLLV